MSDQTETVYCKGKNCGSTNPRFHSADCFAEYDACIGEETEADIKTAYALLFKENSLLRKQLEAVLDAGEEWQKYVIEDNAPMNIRKYLDAAILKESLK